MPRSTAELVVLIAASALAVVLVLVTVGLVFLVDDPSSSSARAVAEGIGSVASVLIGIIVGYMLRDRRSG